MPEPESDYLQRDAGLKEVHSVGVAPSVRSDSAIRKGGAFLLRLEHSEIETESDGFAAERLAVAVGK